MWPNSLETFAEEILNRKLHFLCSVWRRSLMENLVKLTEKYIRWCLCLYGKLSATFLAFGDCRILNCLSPATFRPFILLLAEWVLLWWFLNKQMLVVYIIMSVRLLNCWILLRDHCQILLLMLGEPNPFRPNHGQSDKNNLSFYFHTSLWCFKKFYQGQTFSGTTKKCEKNKVNFYLLIKLPEMHKAGRVNIRSEIWRRSLRTHSLTSTLEYFFRYSFSALLKLKKKQLKFRFQRKKRISHMS